MERKQDALRGVESPLIFMVHNRTGSPHRVRVPPPLTAQALPPLQKRWFTVWHAPALIHEDLRAPKPRRLSRRTFWPSSHQDPWVSLPLTSKSHDQYKAIIRLLQLQAPRPEMWHLAKIFWEQRLLPERLNDLSFVVKNQGNQSHYIYRAIVAISISTTILSTPIAR